MKVDSVLQSKHAEQNYCDIKKADEKHHDLMAAETQGIPHTSGNPNMHCVSKPHTCR